MGNMIQDMLAADAPSIVAEIGFTCVWEGTTYACIATDPDVGIDLEDGGLLVDGTVRIKIQRSLFNGGAGPFPDDNDRITFDGDVYKVTRSRARPGSAFVVLTISA